MNPKNQHIARLTYRVALATMSLYLLYHLFFVTETWALPEAAAHALMVVSCCAGLGFAISLVAWELRSRRSADEHEQE